MLHIIVKLLHIDSSYQYNCGDNVFLSYTMGYLAGKS